MDSAVTYLVPVVAGLVGLAVGRGVYRLVARDATDHLREAGPLWRACAMAFCGLSFGAVALRYGPTLQALELCAFAAILLCLTLTDLDRSEIPNACVLAAFAVRLACLLLACSTAGLPPAVLGYYLLSALGVGLALLVTVLVADWLLGGESMGGGDLKLFAVAALYVGWEQSLLLVGLACVLGIASTLLVRRTQGPARTDGASLTFFPFGPSIALACIAVLVLGERIIG